MAPKEPTVSPATPMPKGYGFLSKGNVFLTANTRRKTHDAKKTLYVVTDKGKPLGLRAPRWILKEVHDADRATKNKRQSNVKRRDHATEKEFETAIRGIFPNIPEESLQKVIKRALQKRSGRVGRTGTLLVQDRVQLAVAAHVRHCHTQYDKLVRGPMSKKDARENIKGEALRVLSQWRGARATNGSRRQRKTKVRKVHTMKQANSAKQALCGKDAAPSSSPPPDTSAKQRHNQPHPQLRRRQRNPTRRSRRLNNTDARNLEVLNVFLDDEDGSGSSVESASDDDELGVFLDDFLVGDSEDDPDSDWHSE
ncbi:hypothetical protein B0J13DRAFT_620341 [Dactylonectria estremocensis]|uniref:DUF2293 domain-containing protein n=1 Tax=Dactylonectria estremocensis TaxID=1079267 RepID=A0A9P9F2F9_9HYPO|nr:hypothetical protein B0J13DRAFT_620341 [Dactylonectria estremocensis]